MPDPHQTEQKVVPWNDTVRQNREVRVFVGPSIHGGHWVGIIDKAITAINDELSNKGVKVAIRKVAKEKDADATLDATPGTGLHGQTFLDPQGTGVTQRATIKVPATPRVSQRDPRAREVGPDVRLYILTHELIHALGLSNAAHSKDDVFTRSPVLVQAGVVVNGKGVTSDMVQALDPTVLIPPIRIGAETLANLLQAWPPP
jgi:hypothetical protein